MISNNHYSSCTYSSDCNRSCNLDMDSDSDGAAKSSNSCCSLANSNGIRRKKSQVTNRCRSNYISNVNSQSNRVAMVAVISLLLLCASIEPLFVHGFTLPKSTNSKNRVNRYTSSTRVLPNDYNRRSSCNSWNNNYIMYTKSPSLLHANTMVDDSSSRELNNDDKFDNADNDQQGSRNNSDEFNYDNYTNNYTNSKQFNFGQWEDINGNYLLRPPPTSPYSTEPRALIHFLGGAIVGAAPDITYRYILEKLASNGFLIVSTPYTLSFDHISTCDDIITRFERVAPSLAQQYGPIPVIGVGHSCGALLHLLITTLFPDTPRAANILISYNNKGVKEAVPFFDEVVTPLFVALGQKSENDSTSSTTGESSNSRNERSDEYTMASSTEILNMSIDLARSFVQGNIPSDDELTKIIKKTTPKPLSPIIPKGNIQVPSAIRESIERLINPIVQANVDAGISPLLDQSLDILEQIPSLIQEVADGARDFNPKPESVRAAARRAYRARRTLIIQYDDDILDESEEIESLLREAETVMKNKRPMVGGFDVQRVVLKGSHATPCVAPPLDLASKVEDLVGEDLAKKKLLYKGADETVDEVMKWLEEGNL